jgi:DNA-binding IscR family transcriptional regulator
VTVADVIRAVDGPLVSVRGERPPDLAYVGAAEPLLPLWIGLRANVRSVLEGVTLADLAAGRLPGAITQLAADPQAWANP